MFQAKVLIGPAKGRCVDILHEVTEIHTHTHTHTHTRNQLLHIWDTYYTVCYCFDNCPNASLELWSINGMKLLWCHTPVRLQ